MGDPQNDRASRGISDQFRNMVESQENWAIRYGAEPYDFHLFKMVGLDKLDQWANNTFHGGAGVFAGHHLYIEIGKIDDEGNFQTLKRVHSFGVQEEDGELLIARKPDGRSHTLVVDGKYTPFSQDPIYQMDPHATKPNQLQSADDDLWFREETTKIVFQGTEREVLTLYGGLISAAIDLNNQDLEFDGFGKTAPNGNSFNAELREKLAEIAQEMGIEIDDLTPSSMDKGTDYELDAETPRVQTWENLDRLRGYIDRLEKAASDQWNDVKSHDLDADIETRIPAAAPRTSGPCGTC